VEGEKSSLLFFGKLENGVGYGFVDNGGRKAGEG